MLTTQWEAMFKQIAPVQHSSRIPILYKAPQNKASRMKLSPAGERFNVMKSYTHSKTEDQLAVCSQE